MKFYCIAPTFVNEMLFILWVHMYYTADLLVFFLLSKCYTYKKKRLEKKGKMFRPAFIFSLLFSLEILEFFKIILLLCQCLMQVQQFLVDVAIGITAIV